MKAKDVLKRLIILCDKGVLSNADMDKVLNGMTITNNMVVIGVYCNGMLVTPEGKVVTLSVDKIGSVAWDVSIREKP